jgi:cell division protein FtsQ
MNFIETIKSRKKWILRGTLIGVPLIVVVLLAYGSQRIECREVKVKFTNLDESNFIDAEKVKSIVYKIYPGLKNTRMSDIKTNVIEEAISKISCIERADVYKNIEGSLTITVTQRVPVVRIHDKTGKAYYIDRKGIRFPVSLNFTAPVIVASGNIPEKYSKKLTSVKKDSIIAPILNQITLLAEKIAADPFLDAQFEQIYVTDRKEFELVPRVGPHIVLLGKLDSLDTKFRNLKQFYKTQIKNEGYNKYSYINLKFDNQIVCTKRTDI